MNIRQYIDKAIKAEIKKQLFCDDDSQEMNRAKELLVELSRCADVIPKFGKKMDIKIGRIRYLLSIGNKEEATRDLLWLRKAIKKLKLIGSCDIDDSVFQRALAAIDSLVELSFNIG